MTDRNSEGVSIKLPPIEHDEGMNRTYIPLPGGWEVQTKGKGSTFRICGPGDDPMRLAVPASPYLHDTLARMARDIHAAVSHATAAKDAEIKALRAAVEAVWAAMPRDARYLDPPDGGCVPLHEQVRRMAADATRSERLEAALQHVKDKLEFMAKVRGGHGEFAGTYLIVADALRDHDQEPTNDR